MYDDGNPPERRIFANGYYSEWFEINSGVAQGCPVSPLLFLIIAQGLAVAIKDAEIEGIKIKASVEIILAQFADDTTVFLRNWAELRRVSKPIQKWCGATAMRENITKRDNDDTSRSENPLIQAEDAIVIDNSEITQDEQLKIALDYVNEKLTVA